MVISGVKLHLFSIGKQNLNDVHLASIYSLSFFRRAYNSGNFLLENSLGQSFDLVINTGKLNLFCCLPTGGQRS